MVTGLCVFQFCHSVIMLMTDKSDSHFVVVQLLIITWMYDYRLNWAPLGPIAIINRNKMN